MIHLSIIIHGKELLGICGKLLRPSATVHVNDHLLAISNQPVTTKCGTRVLTVFRCFEHVSRLQLPLFESSLLHILHIIK